MLKNIKYILGAIWLAVVAFFYYKNHNYYIGSNSFLSFFGLSKYWEIWLAPLLVYGGILYYNWYSNRRGINLVISIPRVLCLFFITLLLLGNLAFWKVKPMMYTGPNVSLTAEGEAIFEPDAETVQNNPFYFTKGSVISDGFNFYENAPETMKPYLAKPGFWKIEVGLIGTFIKVYGFTLLFLLASYNLGNVALRKLRDKEEDFESAMLDLVAGLGISSTLLLFFAVAGQFKLALIIPAFLILSAVFYKNLWRILGEIWNYKVEYEFKYSNLVLPGVILFWTFLSIHLFDNLSPTPRGWDGLNRYILIARDIAESQQTVQVGSVYAWELLLALAYSIDSKIALFWTALPGVINFILIFLLCRKYSSRESSALVIAGMIAMPMMSFYLSDENKIDLAHWMFGTGAVIAFINYFKNPKSIYIAGLLAGYAFAVKFTSVFLILGLLAGFAYAEAGLLAFFGAVALALSMLSVQGGFNLGTEFVTSETFNRAFALGAAGLSAVLVAIAAVKKKIKMESVKKLGILLLMILLPILPWFFKNALETKSLAPGSLLFGENEIVSLDFGLYAGCNATSFYEEYDRYIGYNKNALTRIISIPWHATMNDTGARGSYVDIGFLFLGFAVLAIAFAGNVKKNLPLVLFGTSYILFWLLKSYGVVWYGFTMFSFFALILAITFDNLKKDFWGKIILAAALIVWFSTTLSTRLVNFGNPSLMLSHTDVVSYDDVRESIFPYANEMQQFLEENEGIVYKVGTPLGFYIPEMAKRSFDDQLLDNFYCVYNTHGEDLNKVASIFRDLNIYYVLYDSYTSTVGLDPEGTLGKKVNLMTTFLSNYTIPVIYDNIRGYHLFYIPTPEELAEYKQE